jgi:hypothetical protein
MNPTLVFGADPEGFYSRYDKDGVLTVIPPAHYQIDFQFPVTGNDPKHPIFGEADGQNGKVKLIADGAGFEINTCPSTNMRGLYQDIQLGYQMARGVAAQHGDFISVVPAIHFDTEEFRDRQHEFLQSLIFGCDPDRNVYVGQGYLPPVPPLEDALDWPWRYGGGHVHISGNANMMDKFLLSLKMLDIFLGNFLTMSSKNPDLELKRTHRYGRPGTYRYQQYKGTWKDIPNTESGIEYRTPSNSWTTDESIALEMESILRIMTGVVLPNDKLMQVLIEDLQEPTINAIMDINQDAASANFSSAMSML